MTTRRARPGDSIARVLLVGALLVTITFGAAGVDAIAATGHGVERASRGDRGP